ncbi:hypothetical protein RvY_13103, partial [Ramazzottius varieornatus]
VRIFGPRKNNKHFKGIRSHVSNALGRLPSHTEFCADNTVRRESRGKQCQAVAESGGTDHSDQVAPDIGPSSSAASFISA